MKLKEMEEIAKHSKKASTREGSLFDRTATSFFTCRTGRPRGRVRQGGRRNKARPKGPRDTAGWEGILASARGKPCLLSPAGERLVLRSVATNVPWPK